MASWILILTVYMNVVLCSGKVKSRMLLDYRTRLSHLNEDVDWLKKEDHMKEVKKALWENPTQQTAIESKVLNKHLLNFTANSGSILGQAGVKNPSEKDTIRSTVLKHFVYKDKTGSIFAHDKSASKQGNGYTVTGKQGLQASGDLYPNNKHRQAINKDTDTWQKLTFFEGGDRRVAMETRVVHLLQCLLSVISSCSANIPNVKGHENIVRKTMEEIGRLLMQSPHDGPKLVNPGIKHLWERVINNKLGDGDARVMNQETVPTLYHVTHGFRKLVGEHMALYDEVAKFIEESTCKALNCKILHHAFLLVTSWKDSQDTATGFLSALKRVITGGLMDLKVKGLAKDVNMVQQHTFETKAGTRNLVKSNGKLPSSQSKSMLVKSENSESFSPSTLQLANDGKSIGFRMMSDLEFFFDKVLRSHLFGTMNGHEKKSDRTGSMNLESREIILEAPSITSIDPKTEHKKISQSPEDNSLVTSKIAPVSIFTDTSNSMNKDGVYKAHVNANDMSVQALEQSLTYGDHSPVNSEGKTAFKDEYTTSVIVASKVGVNDVKTRHLSHVNNSSVAQPPPPFRDYNGSMASEKYIVSQAQNYRLPFAINHVRNMPYAKLRHKREADSANGEMGPGSDAILKSGNDSDIDTMEEKMSVKNSTSDDQLVARQALDGELSYRSHMYMGLVDTRGRGHVGGDLEEEEGGKEDEENRGVLDVVESEPEPESEQPKAESEPESEVMTESVSESGDGEPENESEFGNENENIVPVVEEQFKTVDMTYEDYLDGGLSHQHEIMLPEIESGAEPEPEMEGEPESEPKSESEPESEGKPESESEPEDEVNNPGHEAEPESEVEPEAESPFAEPVPEWEEALDMWEAAWEVHVYTIGILFAILAIYSAVAMLRLWRRQNLLSCGYFISLNLMMLLMGTTRAVYFLVDGYNAQNTFPPIIGYFLFGISFPCLTSAFSILFLALHQTTKVQHISRRILKPVVLTVIIGVHFVLSIATDFIVGYFIKAKVMLLICQVFFVLWGLCLFWGYIILFQKLIISAKRRHKELTRVTESHRNLNGSPMKRPPRLTISLGVKVTLASAILGLLAAGLQVYAMVGIYGVFSEQIPEPWPWWVFQFSMRLIELGMCFTMSYVATQPLRFHSIPSDISARRANGVLNYLLPCQRVCTSQDVEELVDVNDIDGHYQYPNGRFLNESPEGRDGFYGNAVTTEFGDGEETFAIDDIEKGLGSDKRESLTSKEKYGTGTSRTSGSRSRPLSMLIEDNGLIRFREEGDTDGAPVMYSTDDELGSCGDILDEGMDQDIIHNGHIPQEFKAGVHIEYRPPMDESSKLQSVSVPNTGANTPMTPRSFYSADSEGAFSEVFNFRPPSSIHLRESIDRALNYPHFSIQTPDYLSRAGTPDNLDDQPSGHGGHQPLAASHSLQGDHRVYPTSYLANPSGQFSKKHKSSLRSILSHMNRSRNPSRPISRRASEDMLSKGSNNSIGFKSVTSGFRSNGSLSFFDDMSFRTATVDKMAMLEDRKNMLYRSRSNSDSLTDAVQF